MKIYSMVKYDEDNHAMVKFYARSLDSMVSYLEKRSISNTYSLGHDIELYRELIDKSDHVKEKINKLIAKIGREHDFIDHSISDAFMCLTMKNITALMSHHPEFNENLGYVVEEDDVI